MDSLIYDTTLVNKRKKIAVLVDGETASAGEFLTLSFKFQNRTKVFGTRTYGLTSTLRLINFKSNAKLLLATGYYCDKNKNIIDGPVIPDIECSSEECLTKAIE